VLDDGAAESAADGGAVHRRDGTVAASTAELGVNLDELSLSSAAEGQAVVAAPRLVGDVIKHGIVEVDDGDVVLGTEEAAGLSTAVTLLGGLDGGVPLNGVLANVYVLGGLHLLNDVLGVLDTRADSASGAHLGGVAARAASEGSDSVGDDLSDGDSGSVDAGHHNAVGDEEVLRHG